MFVEVAFLINLRQMYGSEIKTGSYPRNRTPTQNTGNNNNNVETSNMNELNDINFYVTTTDNNPGIIKTFDINYTPSLIYFTKKFSIQKKTDQIKAVEYIGFILYLYLYI